MRKVLRNGPLAAALPALTFAALAFSTDAANAQYYPPSRYGYYVYPPGYVPRGYVPYGRRYDPYDRYDYYRRRPPIVNDEEERPRKSKREPFDQPKPDLATAPGDKPVKGPFHIVVSINAQRVSLYGSDGLIRTASVSTGMRGHPTPTGVFTVIGKERYHRSNIYSNAPMPYMQRITWSGVALHEGVLPGYPASHGCIRLGSDFAVFLWKTTKIGARVIVTQDEPAPTEISNAHLFLSAPAPRVAAPVTFAGDIKPMIATAKLAVKSADEPALLVTLNDGLANGAAETPFTKAKFDPYRNGPVSVFVSRKTGKLYVRYDYEPLFEAPVTIKNPERPLGTHVYTAMEAAEGAMRWSAISIPTSAKLEADAKPKKGELRTAALTESDMAESRAAQTAEAALDRIEIAPAVRERIAGLLSVGSSLTVSDYGISDETGRETDFIILTR